jgi:hypothetical protein
MSALGPTTGSKPKNSESQMFSGLPPKADIERHD